jgi:hypothetical protein
MPSAGLLIPEIPEGGGCSKGAQPKKVFIESTGVYSTGTVQVQYIDKCDKAYLLLLLPFTPMFQYCHHHHWAACSLL